MCMTYHYRLICSYNFCLFFYFELKKFSLIYLFNIYVFIWLRWVLVVAGRLLSCGMQTLSCGICGI